MIFKEIFCRAVVNNQQLVVDMDVIKVPPPLSQPSSLFPLPQYLPLVSSPTYHPPPPPLLLLD
jgi:hypothetical protein